MDDHNLPCVKLIPKKIEKISLKTLQMEEVRILFKENVGNVSYILNRKYYIVRIA
jgi:hypothetical protein